MRRTVLVLAMLALLVVSAMPTIAQNYGNDDWGDDNDSNWWDGDNDWGDDDDNDWGDDDDNDWGDDDRQPREPSCDWYDASFDVGRRADDYRVWGWWCHFPRSGWELVGLYYEDYGWVPLY